MMMQHSKRDLSLEEQLISVFSRINVDVNEISRLLAHRPDWRLVEEKASHHGVAPLIYHHLNQLSKDSNNSQFTIYNSQVSSGTMEFFRHAYYENLARNLTLFQELRRILKTLDDRGIKAMVLKGAMLAETVYKNPALRPMSDVDLLIRRQDVDKAEKALLDSGYNLLTTEFSKRWAEKFGGERLYAKWSDFPIYVDVHWYITNYVWMGSDGMEAEAERIWYRACATELLGINTVSLSPEDLILHISIHLAIQHFNFRLIWLRDIAEVVRHYQGKIDWQRIVDRARQLGIEMPMHYSLKCAQELLKAQVPDKVLAELKPVHTNRIETQFFDVHISVSERRLDVIKFLYQYFKIPGIGEKIRFLSGLAFPGVAYMRNRYCIPRSKLVYLYYIYRPWYIFYRAGVALFEFIWLISKKVRSSRLKAQRA
jgi:hypothetical protein